MKLCEREREGEMGDGYLLPLPETIVVLVQTLPCGHIVAGVEAGGANSV